MGLHARDQQARQDENREGDEKQDAAEGQEGIELEAVGLVESQKRGRVRTCRLKPAAMTDAERWLTEQRAVWEARLDRLEAYVKTIEKKSRKRRLK